MKHTIENSVKINLDIGKNDSARLNWLYMWLHAMAEQAYLVYFCGNRPG